MRLTVPAPKAVAKPASTLWICGKFHGSVGKHVKWSFEGVFDSEQKAIDACATESYFIGPAKLNESISSQDDVIWPDCYYPKLRNSLSK